METFTGMTTRRFLGSVCEDVRRHIVSFLSTQDYGTLVSLQRSTETERSIYEGCVNVYKVHSQTCFNRLKKRPTMRTSVRHLHMDCNDGIGTEPMSFENVRTLTFFTTHWVVSMDWSRFFHDHHFPRLEEVEWLRIPFVRGVWRVIERVLVETGIGERLRGLRILPCLDLTMSTDVGTEMEDMMNVYRQCPNMEHLVLDHYDMYNESPYFGLFESNGFKRLRTLYMVNRSLLLMDYVLRDECLLPCLEELDISWICPLEEEMMMRQGVALYIHKRMLERLRLNFCSGYVYEWNDDFDSLPCVMHLYSSRRVSILKTSNIHLDMMECCNGYILRD